MSAAGFGDEAHPIFPFDACFHRFCFLRTSGILVLFSPKKKCGKSDLENSNLESDALDEHEAHPEYDRLQGREVVMGGEVNRYHNMPMTSWKNKLLFCNAPAEGMNAKKSVLYRVV